MSFTLKIVLGLLLGVATGVFFGEMAAPLSIVGMAFVSLLQMTVLPYIVVSLISNIGSITWSGERRRLLVSAIVVLAALLSLGIAVLVLVPLAFPAWEAASFFSPGLVAAPPLLDFVGLYIPANPFASMSNNLVPAVVLFSILLGVGISRVPGNGGLLRGLQVLGGGINQINGMVIRLTPVGVFAIAAGTAGTISITEIGRLQAYLITYTVICAVMSFVVLPLLSRPSRRSGTGNFWPSRATR